MNVSQSDRRTERRHLAPYFVAAALIHGMLLIYYNSELADWQALPLGQISLSLGKQAPAPAPTQPRAPHGAVTHTPASQPERKIAKPLAIPTIKPAPSGTPSPTANASDAASNAAPTKVEAAAAPPASSPASPPVTPDVAGSAQAAALVPPRFDAAYLLNPKPDYPAISRRLGEEGKVLLKVRVTAQGLPAAVDIEKTSGFERLDEAARRVVARWRFVPARRGEQPVEASVIVPISFRLEG